MQKKGKSQTTGRAAERAEREERLAQALRDNLRRRKAQARAKADAAPPENGDKPPEDTGGG
ncbi:MAG TPA: hypothetical protein VJR58_01040 [Vineibacter sp.]|nr:hypothetical protein [Vineibacter sp.]